MIPYTLMTHFLNYSIDYSLYYICLIIGRHKPVALFLSWATPSTKLWRLILHSVSSHILIRLIIPSKKLHISHFLPSLIKSSSINNRKRLWFSNTFKMYNSLNLAFYLHHDLEIMYFFIIVIFYSFTKIQCYRQMLNS